MNITIRQPESILEPNTTKMNALMTLGYYRKIKSRINIVVISSDEQSSVIIEAIMKLDTVTDNYNL